jgi:protein tyrosine/serine phosphatase
VIVARERELSIEGLANARDLGGLRTRDGRAIKAGAIVRSDSPKALTEQGHIELMAIVGPRTIIDLRSAIELERDGYVLKDESVTIVNFPMQPLSGVNQEQIDAGAFDNLIDDYMGQLEINGDSIIEALRAISSRDQHPIMYHCSAGKDRTGIVTAMLLDILGVEHEVIANDYHLTTANMAPILERIRTAPIFKENGLAFAPDWLFASDPETMLAFFERMTQRYGNAESWALQRGLTQSEIDAIREHLLEL